MRTVEVAIIGAGSAGLTARREVAKETDSYVVIDDGELGTTCARVGCMPSKVLIQIANDFHRRSKLLEQGISGGDDLRLNQKLAFEHVRKLRDRFVRGVKSGMESWEKTHLIRKRAKFIDDHTLDLGDEKIYANRVIITTGSSPVIPESWKEFQDFFITTDHFFEQEEMPKRVAVIGLGVIGMELGQALNRLGVEIVAIGRGRAIGGVTDPDLQEYIIKKMSEELNIVFGGVRKLERSKNGVFVHTQDKVFEVDRIILAMGRSPQLKGLQLENTSIPLNDFGVPIYDNETSMIQGTRHFIAGDVNSDRPILHEAADEGAIAGYNAVRTKVHSFQRRIPMGITFCSPNIAFVGETYKKLKDRSADFVIGKVTFEGQGRSIVMLQEKGLLHVYVDHRSGKILGAEMFGPSAEHIAHLLAWVIQFGKDVHEVLALPFYHPVIEEGLRTALRDAKNQLLEKRKGLEIPIKN
ncbi:MAG: dihydrolipoyl dehydrogenase [Bdellovibrionaceae bacterium]|nr:dihydrolipoyl dehydrogenase [Pseudobdellovibrionaceae bacterium]|tara:strand:+ start:1314 stop:2714 length:1401 start_codon:yes stop_codon:yes gene_type:complete